MVQTHRGAQVAGEEAGGWASPPSLGNLLCLSSPRKVKVDWGGRTLTKPIIFTYGLLPASRHVILNGLGDPRAGFEPWQSMVSQMRL